VPGIFCSFLVLRAVVLACRALSGCRASLILW